MFLQFLFHLGWRMFCSLLVPFEIFHYFSLSEILPLTWNFPQFNQPTEGLFSPNTHRINIPFTQDSIIRTILSVGEGCKEMEWGHSIFGSKRILKLFQTPLNFTPTLDSWLDLNFSLFCYEKRISGSSKHFQHPIFLMKFCILFEIQNCCKHHKHKARDGISDFLFAWSKLCI